jgi:hypothetical protein
MSFLMAIAAMHQFLTMWMLVTSGAFWQNIFVVGFTRKIAVYLHVALSAIQMCMPGSC